MLYHSADLVNVATRGFMFGYVKRKLRISETFPSSLLRLRFVERVNLMMKEINESCTLLFIRKVCRKLCNGNSRRPAIRVQVD